MGGAQGSAHRGRFVAIAGTAEVPEPARRPCAGLGDTLHLVEDWARRELRAVRQVRMGGTGVSEYFAHPSADIEPGVVIGADTRIWHLAHVRSGAVIGAGCTVGRNVYVDAGVRIGDHVKVQNNVSVYAGVTLEDGVFVGPSAVFTNDFRPRAQNPDWVITPTLVRRGASIGANATIVAGNEIGEGAMVGAGSVVTHPVADHELVVGNPARRLGWVCDCGEVVARGNVRPASVVCPACAVSGNGARTAGTQVHE